MNAFRITPCSKLVLALLILVASFLMVPQPAYAVCCQWEHWTDYFADAAKTQYCGTCGTDCDGIPWCEGQTGPYSTFHRACCWQCEM
jgi:hypothetical protein